jgi:outer membrane protein OmpA-like peptidoglycan-associated protein
MIKERILGFLVFLGAILLFVRCGGEYPKEIDQNLSKLQKKLPNLTQEKVSLLHENSTGAKTKAQKAKLLEKEHQLNMFKKDLDDRALQLTQERAQLLQQEEELKARETTLIEKEKTVNGSVAVWESKKQELDHAWQQLKAEQERLKEEQEKLKAAQEQLQKELEALKEAKAKFALLQAEFEEKKANMQTQMHDIEAAKREVEAQKEKLSHLQEELAQAKSAIAAKEQKIAAFGEEKKSYESKLASLMHEIKTAALKVREEKQKMALIQADLTKDHNMTAAQKAELKQRFQALEEREKALEEAKTAFEEEKKAYEAKLAEPMQEIKAAALEVRAEKDRVSLLQSALLADKNATTAKMAEVEEGLKKVRQRQHALDEKEAKLAEREKLLNEKEAKLAEEEKAYQARENALKAAAATAAALTSKQQDERMQLEALQGDIESQKSQLEAMKERLAQEREALQKEKAHFLQTVKEQETKLEQEKKRAVTDKIKDILNLTKIKFKTGSAQLTPKSKLILDEIADIIKAHPEFTFEVQGHTDSRGKEAFNLTLSASRAQAVKTYLMKKGVAEKQLIARGYGSAQPIADNKTAIGRNKNRRVVIRVVE